MTQNCTNCGAPLTAVDGKAHFRCEHCSSLWFPPESEEGVRILHEAAEYACPVCATPLAEGVIEEQSVAHCPKCKGILTSTRSFYEIVSLRRMRATAPFTPERPVDPIQLLRAILCPSCQETMSAHPYYGPGNAIVDSCGNCLLVWLDHSELTVIASAPAQA